MVDPEGPYFVDPATLETLDEIPTPGIALFTVHGCPLMTRVPAAHPYFDGFHVRSQLSVMDQGQIITGHCNGTNYLIERVR